MDRTAGTSPQLRLLIAVSVRLYRDGLAATLNSQGSLRVTGAAATSREALEMARSEAPDIAVIDVSLDDAAGLISALRQELDDIRIVAFAVREDISEVLTYAEAGADGFVTAQSSTADLIEAIERTAAGELLCSPRMAAQLLRRAAHRLSTLGDRPGASLTLREEQVFVLLQQGLSNKEIASSLNIAEATVKNHVHHVLEKLQVPSRGQAVASGRFLKAPLRTPFGSRQAG